MRTPDCNEAGHVIPAKKERCWIHAYLMLLTHLAVLPLQESAGEEGLFYACTIFMCTFDAICED